jgi:hypothetical protein
MDLQPKIHADSKQSRLVRSFKICSQRMTTAVLPEAYSSDVFPTVTLAVCCIRVEVLNSLLSFIEQWIHLGCLAIGADVYGRNDGSKIFSISFPVGKKFVYELSYVPA